MMNLYDKDDGFKVFTLEQANEILPKVIRITEETVEKLSELKALLNSLKKAEYSDSDLEVMTQDVLAEWNHRIIDLGIYPKGYFTVDFKTPVPDTLFCWTFGEDQITHTHKIYETFKNRIRIKDDDQYGFEESIN